MNGPQPRNARRARAARAGVEIRPAELDQGADTSSASSRGTIADLLDAETDGTQAGGAG
jgi:hypothetical protein